MDALTLHGTRLQIAQNQGNYVILLKRKTKTKKQQLMKYTKILNNYISKIQQDQYQSKKKTVKQIKVGRFLT